MPRYLVSKRRGNQEPAPSSQEALAGDPEVTVVDARNADMTLIDASEAAVARLQQKLGDHYWIEPEIRRGLH